MDEWTNEELVRRARNGCARARDLLLEQNEALIVSRAKLYWEGIYASGMDKSLTQDDFIQLARIEFWKAIGKFRPELGNRFSTYACVCIENKLKDLMRAVSRRYNQSGGELVSLDHYVGTEDRLTYREQCFDLFQEGPEEIVIRRAHSRWIYYALHDLPEREQAYAIYRYSYPDGKKKSQTQTARHFYLTRVRAEKLEEATRRMFLKNYWRKTR